MKITHRYPLALHTCASPIPVFPAVPSTTVPPGFNLPSSHRVSPPNGRGPKSKRENEPSRSLSILDDPKSRTIFDAPTRVLELGFPVNLGPGLLRQLLEINLVGPRVSAFQTPHNTSSPSKPNREQGQRAHTAVYRDLPTVCSRWHP